jgi:signal transduction histidine kinase
VRHEPDILSIFRLFAILWLGLFLLGGGILFISQAFSPPATIFFIAGIANALLLLGYLSWPRLRRCLGSAYLRIGVVIAAAGPIVVNHLVSFLHIRPPGTASSFDTWPLAASLFVPLVIVAWQHPLSDVGWFCLGTAFLDLLLTWLTAEGNSVYFFSVAHGILTRTISFFLVGYMVAWIMAVQQQQRQSLAEANARLTRYAATLDQLATTRERNRLARELHDTIAHTLSAVAVELEAVSALWNTNPVQARALLEQSLAATRAGLTETRRALQALRSTPLEDYGLALAVRQEAESVAARADLSLDLDIPKRMENLPPDVEQCVYRIAQEALVNVMHHAQARRVTVTLHAESGRLTLTISDDGCGFEPDAVDADRHLGIRGMRERAEVIGGILEIESTPGRGTTVRLIREENDDSRADL